MKFGLFPAFFFFALCPAFLAGCASNSLQNADESPFETTLKRREITAGQFRLSIFSRIRDINQPVTVYIEGDVPGLAPAADPGLDSTPDEYLGLRLASLDPSDNVILISHPCQYGIEDFACKDGFSSDERWANQFYISLNRALNYALAVIPHPHLNLVGYSGGAALAAIIAARRTDVLSLRTIAGNLDPDGNGRFHATDPQDDFIDPMQIAPRLASLPQEHFVGDRDDFVPPFLTENFVKAIGVSYCVKVTHVPFATHTKGWEAAWRQYVTKVPVCSAPPSP